MHDGQIAIDDTFKIYYLTSREEKPTLFTVTDMACYGQTI